LASTLACELACSKQAIPNRESDRVNRAPSIHEYFYRFDEDADRAARRD
jgi:hypothetical protein